MRGGGGGGGQTDHGGQALVHQGHFYSDKNLCSKSTLYSAIIDVGVVGILFFSIGIKGEGAGIGEVSQGRWGETLNCFEGILIRQVQLNT